MTIPKVIKKGVFPHKDLVSMEQLSEKEIYLILDKAKMFKEISLRNIKKVPALKGKTVINLFFEPSTRTRTSFEIAAKRLSADIVNITSSASAVVKGETLLDTAQTLMAMKPDFMIIRHSFSGSALYLSRIVSASVLNAGDGLHEHPTQALLDMYTMREYKHKLEGLKVAIVGDIAHSRVARSNIIGLNKVKAEVMLVGPKTLIPTAIEKMNVRVSYDLKEALSWADVVMMLRIQLERLTEGLFPTIREYSMLYGLNKEVLRYLKKDAIIMHPGPINRNVEISPDVVNDKRCVILNQVENGVAVRMAVLFLLRGAEKVSIEQ
ncbi:MAG: aspartate carbamoyltransferase catalytic subunit [Myxococcota bacterium]